MKSWIKENKTRLLLTGLLAVVGIPIVIYLLSSIPLFPIGGNNDWAGFWGCYLGAIMGGIVTLLVMKGTLENNRKSDRRKEKIDFCYRIAELVAEYATEIMDSFRCLKNYIKAANEGGVDATYDIAIQKVNYVSRLNCLIVILLEGRVTDSEYKDIETLNKKLEDIAHKCDSPFSDILERNDIMIDIETLEIEVQQMVCNLQECMQEFSKKNFID